eukprot:scaffold125972_cov60-Phaeocystis_antarctica.AAC.1
MHAVTASGAYGRSVWCIGPQPLMHTVTALAHKVGACNTRRATAPPCRPSAPWFPWRRLARAR